jgi:hypothetical protein
MTTFRVQLYWDDTTALIDVEGDVTPSGDGSEYVVTLGQAFDARARYWLGPAADVLRKEDQERAEDELADKAREAEAAQ